jgi:hypothetical protein
MENNWLSPLTSEFLLDEIKQEIIDQFVGFGSILSTLVETVIGTFVGFLD